MIIDIHSHIIPGVDDGACDIEMAIEMARIYLENGTKKVIATPHYVKKSSMNNTYSKNVAQLNILRDELEKENLNLEIYLGNEIYIYEDILVDLEDEKITTMNKGKYILIELPIFDIPVFTNELFENLQKHGYIPVIAHPERNHKIIDDPNLLFKLINNGCLVQLNIPSLEGKYGKEIKHVAEKLCKNKMVHFIGTDTHSSIRRTPNVSRGLEELEKLIGEEEFTKITQINPLKLLADEDVEISEPLEIKRKFSFKGIFK